VCLFYPILVTLLVALPALAQDAPKPSPFPKVEDIYLARDDGKGKAGEEVKEFVTTDVPIWCVVLLDSNGKTTVRMNFVAVKVPGVRAETKVVSASYTTKEGQNRVNFTGRPEGTWPPGRYRVDIFIDDKPSKNLEFDIKGRDTDTAGAGGIKPAPGSKPQKQPKINNIAKRPE
jgi:hypothetical protein